MLRYLTLNNLLLIDSCQIEFGKKLNVLSGETGSGKSTVMEAIALICGQRADPSLIRKGFDKAVIEAIFEIHTLSPIRTLLQDFGIHVDAEEDLIIRREISNEGKNRTLINCQTATLPVLQKITPYLIDLVTQNSHEELRLLDKQRAMLDLYADTQTELLELHHALMKEKACKAALQDLIFLNETSAKQKELYLFELQELTCANIQENEEEKILEEHHKLSHIVHLMQKLQKIQELLTDSPAAALSTLCKIKHCAESIVTFDTELQEPLSLLGDALVHLNEASRLFTRYFDKLEEDPARFTYLETRLREIQQIKKKYSAHYPMLHTYIMELKHKLETLENLDEKIQEANLAVRQAEIDTAKWSRLLSQKRKEAADALCTQIHPIFRSFNMQNAIFEIRIRKQPLSHSGEDLVEFWLQANKGEPPAMIKEGASGGELSRLFLSLKVLLAEKNNTPTMIFDEIDANIGGETAVHVGEQLRFLGKSHQILCITHFPQVAYFADHHFCVKKEIKEERTLMSIQLLDCAAKEKELLRMLGGKKLALYGIK